MSFSAFSVRARLVTAKNATRSAAPDEARRTVGVMPAALSFGTTTAVTPAALGTAQARAEVVRIGHAVENQQ